MSDVVSRLLAAIDERERRYAERARDWREGMSDDEERYWRRLNPDGPRVWEPPAEVVEGLRLCQAHRDIVAEWAKRKQMADQLAAERYVGDAVIAAEAIVAGLWAAVTLVARGYGVEGGETK